MKTTYINNEGVKVGFIISGCGRWVDCFKGSESNIINSFFTFGRGSSHSQNNTPSYQKNEIVIQQRFAVLFRKQKFVTSECDKLNFGSFESKLKLFENRIGKSTYAPSLIDKLNTLTNNRELTISLCKELLIAI